MKRRKSEIVNKKWVRSKRSLGSKASVKSLKRYCKEIWAEYVKQRDGYKCTMCDKSQYLNSHHIITSKCLETKYDTDCGITLCPLHHRLGKVSAHGAPWVLFEWLEDNRPEQYKWFLDNKEKVYLSGKVPKDNMSFYKDILKNLLDKFERDYPTILKRSQYFKFTGDEEKLIVKEYVDDEGASLSKISEKFKCTNATLKCMLDRQGIQPRKNPKKHLSKERRRELRDTKIMSFGRPVIQLDMSGKYIAEFLCIKDAGRITSTSRTSIGNHLKGRTKSAGGYLWKYKLID